MTTDGTSATRTLLFPDRRRQGGYPVTDVSGRVVASIRTTWTGLRFSADDAAGVRLCSAEAAAWGLSGRWRVTDGQGAPLLTVRKAALRARGEIELASGTLLVALGTAWRRDFEVRDAHGRPVLSAVPRTGALSLHPHDYAVQVLDEALSLPEALALVQVWRMIRKSEDLAAAGTVAATSTAAYGG